MQYHRGYHGGRADDPHGVTAPKETQSMQWAEQQRMFDPNAGKKATGYGSNIGANGSMNPGAPPYRRGGGNADWQKKEPDTDMGVGDKRSKPKKGTYPSGGPYSDWQKKGPDTDMGGGSRVPKRPKAPASGGGAYASMGA